MVEVTNSMIKRAQMMQEQGYSNGMIARCLNIPEWMVRFMVRRE